MFGKSKPDALEALLARVERIERLCPGLVSEREFAAEQAREKDRQEAHDRAVSEWLKANPAPDLVRLVAVKYLYCDPISTKGEVVRVDSSAPKKWREFEVVAGGAPIHKATCPRLKEDPQILSALANNAARIEPVPAAEAQSIHLRERRDAPRRLE